MPVVTVDYEINIEAEGDELILQNISNILRTYKGENALNREIGINPSIVDSSTLFTGMLCILKRFTRIFTKVLISEFISFSFSLTKYVSFYHWF